MAEFNAFDTGIIVTMVIVYILFTSWLTVRLRSRTAAQFMTASRALPPAVIGVLLMSEFIGAKSTVGTSQEAFTAGFAASWSVLAAAIGFLFFGLFLAKRLYTSGEFTISGLSRSDMAGSKAGCLGHHDLRAVPGERWKLCKRRGGNFHGHAY